MINFTDEQIELNIRYQESYVGIAIGSLINNVMHEWYLQLRDNSKPIDPDISEYIDDIYSDLT